MNVLSIDGGLATTGWSIINSINGELKLIDYGIISTEAKSDKEDRLFTIYNDLNFLIEKYTPDEMAIESLFYFKNQKTIMSVSEARGVIIITGRIKNLDIFNYTPLQVKTSVTGYGRAEKSQIQKMVKSIFKLAEIPTPDDAADAIAIGICHINSKKNSTINNS